MSDGPTPLDPDDLPVGDVFPIEPTPEVVAACEEESRAFVVSQTSSLEYWPWVWLESTRRLQSEYFGVTYPLEGEKLADYVTWNSLALIKEVSELTDEFGWKTWAKPRGWVNRENALKEAVDVAHFLANILCAIDVTDEEWVAAYQAKQEVNRQRQREDYDGVTGKCPKCKRSYDDGIECVPGVEGLVRNGTGQVCVNVDGEPYCAYV